MARYFNSFPKILYDINNNGNDTLVTDIFRRIKVRDGLKNNAALFARYDVQNGDTPETISFKHFGTVDFYWIVCMMNDITDRYYDWPLSDQAFEAYVKDKYANPQAIHHYEKTQSSGAQSGNGPDDYSHKIEVNSTDPDAQSVSNYEYELREQDRKRNIKLLNPEFLGVFVQEFEKLVRR